MPADSDQWYVAVLVVACTVGSREREGDAVDLQCRLIRARSAEQAYQLAMDLGARQNQSYQNEDGEIVSWEFKGLHRLECLADQALEHGVEVYSSLVTASFRDLVATKEDLWEFRLLKDGGRTVGEYLEDAVYGRETSGPKKPRLH